MKIMFFTVLTLGIVGFIIAAMVTAYVFIHQKNYKGANTQAIENTNDTNVFWSK